MHQAGRAKCEISKEKKRKRKRMTTRRGKKKSSSSPNSDFVLLHMNPRGLRSKLASINHVVNNIVKPNCISLNEHGIVGNNKVNIENYKSFVKNRSASRMGGVALSVPDDDISSYVKIAEGEGTDEFVIIRNDKYTPALNIVTVCGSIESRSNKTDIEETWNRFCLELTRIETRNESILIAGDFNVKIGDDGF